MEPGYWYAIGAAVMWGLLYAVDGKILARVEPMSLLLLQSSLIALLTLPFFLMRNGLADLTRNRSIWPLVMLTALLAVTANFWILKSIKLIGPTTASFFEISYPFFVALFSILLLGSRVSIPTIAGGVLIFLGSIIVIRYG